MEKTFAGRLNKIIVVKAVLFTKQDWRLIPVLRKQGSVDGNLSQGVAVRNLQAATILKTIASQFECGEGIQYNYCCGEADLSFVKGNSVKGKISLNWKYNLFSFVKRLVCER